MYVTSKQHIVNYQTHISFLVYMFLDSVVGESSSERLLGVTINNDLSWNTQVENVTKMKNLYLLIV